MGACGCNVTSCHRVVRFWPFRARSWPDPLCIIYPRILVPVSSSMPPIPRIAQRSVASMWKPGFGKQSGSYLMRIYVSLSLLPSFRGLRQAKTSAMVWSDPSPCFTQNGFTFICKIYWSGICQSASRCLLCMYITAMQCGSMMGYTSRAIKKCAF